MSSASHRSSSEVDRPPAVLVGIQLQGVLDEALASSLDELERLTKTLGLRVIGRVTQKRRGLGAANLLGEGKLRIHAAAPHRQETLKIAQFGPKRILDPG